MTGNILCWKQFHENELSDWIGYGFGLGSVSNLGRVIIPRALKFHPIVDSLELLLSDPHNLSIINGLQQLMCNHCDWLMLDDWVDWHCDIVMCRILCCPTVKKNGWGHFGYLANVLNFHNNQRSINRRVRSNVSGRKTVDCTHQEVAKETNTGVHNVSDTHGREKYDPFILSCLAPKLCMHW